PSPTLHALALPLLLTSPPFPSYAALIDAVRTVLLSLVAEAQFPTADTAPEARGKLHAILGSHPRLGERKKAVGAISKNEQRHLNNTEEGKTEGETELERSNREYEERFPGLRYVVWVNGRGRAEVLEDMKRRTGEGSLEGEERAGVGAMCDIAADRARKLGQV
ncbi:Oxo-4-hydroxy-4-carboxy-5-ureidoimidazoline decarboxylase, partial [Staphylotrichum tortipilum]